MVHCRSKLELTLHDALKLCGLAKGMEIEYRFHPKRRWRFDFAFPAIKLAIECDGGVWTRGRHSRGKGYEGDCDKINAAILLGWRVLRFTNKHIKSGVALNVIEEAMRA